MMLGDTNHLGLVGRGASFMQEIVNSLVRPACDVGKVNVALPMGGAFPGEPQRGIKGGGGSGVQRPDDFRLLDTS
jgi:hypothetical protein